MYVANVVDTGLFRAVGKSPNETYRNLRTAVRDADATLHLPETIYRELGGDPTTETPPSGSEYADEGIREGWITVAEPLPGDPERDRSDAHNTVARARHDTHHVIARTTNHPKTVNEWNDTALVGLAVRLFERNERIRVIVHTTDRALATATRAVVPEYGYYDIETNLYPPRTVQSAFPDAENFR